MYASRRDLLSDRDGAIDIRDRTSVNDMEPAMDAIDTVLSGLRLHSTVFTRMELVWSKVEVSLDYFFLQSLLFCSQISGLSDSQQAKINPDASLNISESFA